MKKSVIKNIAICLLAVACAFLTVRLWFGGTDIQGLFPAPVAAAVSPVGQPRARHMITSASIGISPDGIMHHITLGNISEETSWHLAEEAITALISDGSHRYSGVLDDDAWAEIFGRPSIFVQYNFSMPTSFFREHFGQRQGFLSGVFGSFEALVIAPAIDGALFYFISHADGSFHAFATQDSDVRASLAGFFEEIDIYGFIPTHRMEGAELLPVWTETTAHTHTSPIGELRLATVEPFVRFFFPDPNAIIASPVNDVFTYRHGPRVVRFYHNNILDYRTQPGRGTGVANFTTSFLAALDMKNRNEDALEALGTNMNDITFVGYYYDVPSGRWTFYFDYVANNMPVDLGREFYPLTHAIEIQVTNNTVTLYRRLMLVFVEDIQ
ncbi:MAG: hypothetical protein FWC93_00485 [Defluviitaleaceae bacterium]|nr:hypothetical protein [Defluviitaleaceae bacterium]